MTRNLKALGLALVAVFALGLVSASAASAEVTQPIAHFTSSEYPSYVEGNQIGNHEFEVFAGTITCKKAHFSSQGHQIGNPTTSLTVTPEYSECTTKTMFGASRPTTVTTNGCWYTFTVHEKGATHEQEIETPDKTKESAVTHTWAGDVHLKCPGGIQGIEVHVYENATKHTENKPLCTYTVKPQTIKNIHYAVHTVGGVATYTTVEAQESEVKVNRTSGTLLNCGAAEQTAKYNGNTTVETRIERLVIETEKGKVDILSEMIEGNIGNVSTF